MIRINSSQHGIPCCIFPMKKIGLIFVGCILAILLSLPLALTSGASIPIRKNQSAIKIDPKVVEAVKRAAAAEKARQFDESISILTAALGANPPPKIAAFLYARRARVFMKKDSLGLAKKDVDKCLRLDPNSAEGYWALGLLDRREIKYPEAIAEYTHAINLLPGFIGAYNGRGVAYSYVSEFSKAIADFNTTLRLDPGYADAYTNRAAVFDALGDIRRALNDYNEAIRLRPSAVGADYYDRAGHFIAQGAYEKALRDLNEPATRTQIPDLLLHVARAHVYHHLKMSERAIAEYRAATKCPVSDPGDHVSRGDAFSELGEYRRAAADFTIAKQEASNDTYTLRADAWFKATCPVASYRDGKEAVREAKRVCDYTHWRTSDSVDTYAAACAEVGNYPEAIKYQELAIRLAGKFKDPDLQKALQAFQQHRPWRDKPLSNS